jgi:hypothetical protein
LYKEDLTVIASTSSPVQQLLDFLNTKGIENLARWYSIRIRRSETFYHLLADEEYSPFTVDLVRACHGTVVEQTEDSKWNIVCYGYPKFWYYLPLQGMENPQPSKQFVDTLRQRQLIKVK